MNAHIVAVLVAKGCVGCSRPRVPTHAPRKASCLAACIPLHSPSARAHLRSHPVRQVHRAGASAPHAHKHPHLCTSHAHGAHHTMPHVTVWHHATCHHVTPPHRVPDTGMPPSRASCCAATTATSARSRSRASSLSRSGGWTARWGGRPSCSGSSPAPRGPGPWPPGPTARRCALVWAAVLSPRGFALAARAVDGVNAIALPSIGLPSWRTNQAAAPGSFTPGRTECV